MTIKRKVKLPPSETLKPVEPKKNHFDTQLQDVVTMPRQLPHVQADNRQLIEPRLEIDQISALFTYIPIYIPSTGHPQDPLI